MQFTSLSFFSLVTLSLSLSAAARNAPRRAQDVFTPEIYEPNAETVWTVGSEEVVTWDTSKAPVNISNGASIQLNTYGRIDDGFDLRDGCANVTVPADVAPGIWTITLFGDSGDISQPFKIVAADDSEAARAPDPTGGADGGQT